jgi:dihydrofolate reductase
VVVTRNPEFRAEGVTVSGSLDEALALFPPSEEVFVIGGGEIYRAAMPLADRLYLTRVGADYKGDTSFPEVNPAEWTLLSSEHHPRGRDFPHPFDFQIFERKRILGR